MGKTLAKFIAPTSDRLVRHDHTTLKEQLLNAAQAQLETELPANGATDNYSRETVTVIRRFRVLHRAILLGPPNNLTMPSRELVAAGAFHSIYGTEEFREKAVGLERRPEIQQVIGEEAERLVYLFCLADRRALFSGQSAPCPVPLPSTGACVDLDELTLAALLELEAANIVDGAWHQPDAPAAAGEFWMTRFESVKPRLSKGAYQTAREALTKWNPDEVRKRMLDEGWVSSPQR